MYNSSLKPYLSIVKKTKDDPHCHGARPPCSAPLPALFILFRVCSGDYTVVVVLVVVLVVLVVSELGSDLFLFVQFKCLNTILN